MGRSRRQFSPEFKRDAVELLRSSGRPISQVARGLGCGESSLSLWTANDRVARALADPKKFSAETAESDEVNMVLSLTKSASWAARNTHLRTSHRGLLATLPRTG